MNFIKSLTIIVHALVLLAIGGILVSLSLGLFSPDELGNIVNYIYTQTNVKLILGIIGAIFIAAGLLTANINLGNVRMQKTIAFENPEGQVTVSLSAIEDFIKKSVRHLPEVKELRSNVTASKKGINIICVATIFADSNIPATTERIQSIVKSRVHEMLGVEETINIKIHVTKISSKGKGEMPIPPKEHEEMSRRMPFGGIE
ncbi:MAG: alkaline shock response membrane anchor protein AmaP [Candidatus Omnitrophota bacterium]|nr:MAG: alkaline shock response membrane anchor protein AmaP [Candidatus Omnitrophota bacterium]